MGKRVYFEEDNLDVSVSRSRQKPVGGIIGWLIKKKIAKNEQIANAILIVVFLVTLLAIYFTWSGNDTKYKPHTHLDGKAHVH